MSVKTRNQQMAERAFRAVDGQRQRNGEYDSFAKRFPALIHSAGLCQAVAFAQAKGRSEAGKPDKAPLLVLKDVLKTMKLDDNRDAAVFAERVRDAEVLEYLRLSQLVIEAATWVKRYVEAIEAVRNQRPTNEDRDE